MKAVVLHGPNDFATEEIKKPEIGDHEMLLKMRKVAICGTDMRIFAGTKTKESDILRSSATRCAAISVKSEKRLRASGRGTGFPSQM